MGGQAEGYSRSFGLAASGPGAQSKRERTYSAEFARPTHARDEPVSHDFDEYDDSPPLEVEVDLDNKDSDDGEMDLPDEMDYSFDESMRYLEKMRQDGRGDSNSMGHFSQNQVVNETVKSSSKNADNDVYAFY